MDVSWPGILLIMLALFLLLLGAGAIWQGIGSARDRRRYTPPGHLVDLGGYRLHIRPMGEGNPTVVFDSAMGGSCLSWTLVQPEVSTFTQTCSYDRAGFGWSDTGPSPRTVGRVVEELHDLLQRSRIGGPYVLVGHSYGGLAIRLFASRFPEEVAGMVLVDPANPQEWMEPNIDQQRRLDVGGRLSRRAALLARFGIIRLLASLANRWTPQLARASALLIGFGLIKAEHEGVLAPARRLPSQLRSILSAFWTQPKFFRALASQIEFVPEGAAQVSISGDYGHRPLIVLSATNPSPERVREQEEVAQLSSAGKHVIASDSGHWIPLDQPEVVIAAIREVVDAVRAEAYQAPE